MEFSGYPRLDMGYSEFLGREKRKMEKECFGSVQCLQNYEESKERILF